MVKATSGAARAAQDIHSIPLRPRLLTAALIAAGLGSPALHAAPEGGVVRGGSAALEYDGAQTRIRQSSERAIIDWRGFDLGARESVRFEQPSNASATLNRVTSNRASQIDGQIGASGQVFIVNRAGVIFGRSARIDVAGLIATTANLSNADFLAGRLNFLEAGQPGAEVRNEGRISAADGGLVALVAPRVRNDGVITARLGRIALASGDTFTVDLDGDQLIQFALPAEEARQLENYGTALADGGEIILISAATARRVVDSVVNLSGVLRADTVEQQDGRIILGASGSEVTVSGQLQARAVEPGTHGGTIEITGERIQLAGAALDASGAGGGGTVHVGGRWQGQGEGPRAQQLAVSNDSRIRADGGTEGNGGEVVLWSDGHTEFGGSISARGGRAGGDGGRVEVSGKQSLAFSGQVDAGASAGRGGQLLLDPLDLALGAREASGISRILRTGTTVALQADRDIAVNAAIDGRGPRAGGGVSLSAGRDIAINDFILTQDGAVALTATTGSISFAPGKAVFAGAAPITVTAGGLLASGALLTSGRLSLASTAGAVHIDAPVEAGNGPLQVSAATDIEVNAAIANLQSGAEVDLEAGRDILINAQINGLGAANPGGSVRAEAARNLAVNDFVVTQDGDIALAARDGSVSFAPGKAVFSGTAPLEISAGELLAAGSTVSSSSVRLSSVRGAVHLDAPVEPGNGDLQVSAATDIQINAPVANLVAGSRADFTAGGDIEVNAQINGLGATTPGGAVSLAAGGDIRVLDHVATTDGAVAMNAGGALSVAADKLILSGNAPVDLTAAGRLTSGAIGSTGKTTLSSSGGAVHIDGLIPEDNGDLQVSAATDVQVNAALANPRAGSTVDIAAGRDIVVAAQIDGLGASRAGLVRLTANRNLQIDRFIATRLAPIEASAGGTLGIGSGGGVFSELAAVSLRAGGELALGGPVSSPQGVSLRSDGGSIAVQGAFAPGGAVALTAAQDVRVDTLIDTRGAGAGKAVSINAGRNITASQSIVTNNGAITLVAGGAASFGPSAGLFAGSAPISVRSAGALLSGPIASSGPITLASTAGGLQVGGPIAGGSSVSLSAAQEIGIGQAVQAGTLNASAGSALAVGAPISAGSIGLSAGGSLQLGADVVSSGELGVASGGSTLFAGGGLFAQGGLTLSSAGDMSTGVLSSGGSMSVSSGGSLSFVNAIGGRASSLSLSAGQNLTLSAPIGNFGAGAGVGLSAGGTVAVNSRIDAIGGGVTINAGQDALLNEHIVTTDSPIQITAGGTIVHAADGVDSFGAPQTKQLRAGNSSITEVAGTTLSNGSMITSGSVSVTSTAGDINVDVPIYETTGLTTLVAGGNININQVIANATTGANLVLQAGGDINVNAKVGPWDRSDATFPVAGRNALPGGSISMTAAGNINIAKEIATFKDVLVGDVARLDLTSTAGSVGFTAPNIKVFSDFGTVAISSFNDFVNGPVPATVNTAPTAGYYTRGQLSLTSTGGDVTIASLIPDTTGSVTISAADKVQIDQRIYTNSGDITILAGAGGIVQNPAADPDINGTGVVSDIDARLGNLRLEAVGDIRPTLLRTGSKLTIKSTAGSIIGGEVDQSRDQSVTPNINYGLPDEVELAGFAGISGFNSKTVPIVSALSAGGSITNLAFNSPGTLLLIARDDIATPSELLGNAPRLFAGRDIHLSAVTAAGNVEAKAGRDLLIDSSSFPLFAQSANLSAGFDPFAGIAGTTVAGVALPAWSGPFGGTAGNVTVGGTGFTDTAWIAGVGGLVINAAHDISLPRVHVSYFLGSPDNVNALQLIQPLTLTAGNAIGIEQVETTGPVSFTATSGDITIGSTIGAHVAPESPALGKWNPTDQGVASLNIAATNGNISMHEARATGNITIAAPNGQVTFVGGLTGIETPATRSVTDSDGVAFTNTISAAPVARLASPGIVSPVASPGPTLAGPGAPPVPGAIPPAGPGGIAIASASPLAAGVSLSAPGGGGSAGGAPGSVAGASPGSPGAAGVGSSAPPGSPGDGFGEIFVAAADQGNPEVRDPVRVEVAQRAEEESASKEANAAAGNEEGKSGDEGSQIASAEGQNPDEDKDEKEKDKDDQAQRTTAQGTILVFAGGRGDARERDFGSGLPLEDGRVRP